jgi:hypothetical protein
LKHLLDGLIEDDAEEMVRILPGHIEVLRFDYLLSQAEVDQLVAKVKAKVDASWLRAMYPERGPQRLRVLDLRNGLRRDCRAARQCKSPPLKVVQKILMMSVRTSPKRRGRSGQPKKEQYSSTQQRAA